MTTETATRRVAPVDTAVSATVLPILRIVMGVVFLWPFLDKLLGLGFTTGRDPKSGAVRLFGADAWINGGSPTKGFLAYGVKGPFAPGFHSMAGVALVDWLFMLGMGGVGLALILGIATRIATVAGIALMLTLRLAVWESPTNPVVDEHIVFAVVLAAMVGIPAARRWSLERRWRQLPIVRRLPVLR